MVAVVPAAGRGLRLGADTAKALVPLRGVTLLRRCVDGLLDSGVVDLVVVVAPAELVETARAELPPEVVVVPGGLERSDSVRAGLDEAARRAPGAEHVLVHDAARALTPAALVGDVVAALRAGAVAVVPALPVTDTIKAVDAAGVVTGTPERASLRAVQTPQGFTVEVLRAAHAGALAATDDAALVERAGSTVHTVPGHPLAFKITTATDLALAAVLLEGLA
ncbi:2-C-methyl-D-erythritol 4-phosphate cytidylyltransferase [Rhodococcus antarcticus]|uniref:2-C-methyl-D-erythritol 4-phosphate cytidylyltransferase n=1 Tax=Rhodococcus antarcticus TaxID=2987751 RepID=A0ABY6P687_9NOCA|nr:2-C-methyl-D-erythritol 4-phosphate cytidylyltransferase [Rhodococcus antarcticus]UZJ26698.1 2-C-methyl-D-erythritol 4-phosphate cytidylyltransferase [Rhodococcus antarcticus]